MFTVYGLTCNGLRDPTGVVGHARLSWRLGSDRQGACQRFFRVVAVSLEDGEVVWDTLTCPSEDNFADYAGRPLAPGEICSWFVTVTDDAGTEATSVPAVFVWGVAGDEPRSEVGEERLGIIWTSDDALNASLERRQCLPSDPAWGQLLGLSFTGGGMDRVLVEPPCDCGLRFAQGSLLLPRGLLVVRWDRTLDGAVLSASLPPGTSGELVLGESRECVSSGRHELVIP